MFINCESGTGFYLIPEVRRKKQENNELYVVEIAESTAKPEQFFFS